MNPVIKEFLENETFKKLDHRLETFALMVSHVENRPGLIVETGTARIEGNWGGDGQSTLIWDWLAERLPVRVKSVDINPEFVEIARKQVKHTEVICANSLNMLSGLSDVDLYDMTLLYLDSFDWHPSIALDSMFHHMAELATVWAKLPRGCLVVVDDRHSDTQGKHFMVQVFMEQLGIKPAFVGYQIGWYKP
jgi:predicted O-methyltransferase YrrM